MIAIVDYDAGNLHSVSKAIDSLGLPARVTSDPDQVRRAGAVVLPGVGAFAACAGKLRQFGLAEPVVEAVKSGKPFLGICVGMQILFSYGEEGAGAEGLGILPGRVVRLGAGAAHGAVPQAGGAVPAPGAGLKIPHMGWNELRFNRSNPGAGRLFQGLPGGSHVYFVHSYHAVPEDDSAVAAYTDYGGPVVAAVARDNLFGVQFHPEKSSAVGLKILQNFGELVKR